MRKWLKIWSVPLIALILWYVLSANDWSFGTHLFSREMHDEFFRVYASVLGVPESELPSLAGKAVLTDGSIIGAIIAYRKRKVLFPWIARKFASGRAWANANFRPVAEPVDQALTAKSD